MFCFATLEDEAGRATGFEASGHAGKAVKGENLPCAAASALIQTLVSGFSCELGLKLELRTERDGYLACHIIGKPQPDVQERIELLLRVVERGLKTIAEMDETKSTVVRSERRRDVTRSMDNGT